MTMVASKQQSLIGDLVLSHADAAYNLAHWLLGNEPDASDAVQDAFVRALRSADTFIGGNAKAWWLTIVRNCCLARLKVRRRDTRLVDIDQVSRGQLDHGVASLLPQTDPHEVEDRAFLSQESENLKRQFQKLSPEYREIMLLREVEELSYREIADTLQIPVGTVMSRLARAREKLTQAMTDQRNATGARS